MNTWNEPVIPKRKGAVPKLEVEQEGGGGPVDSPVENNQPVVQALTEVQQLQQKIRNLQVDLDAAEAQIRELWEMIGSRDEEINQYRRMGL